MAKPRPDQIVPSPAWRLEKGLSYTLISKFCNCRERFRLYSVLGMREKQSGSRQETMDWGSYFHKMLELHAKKPERSADSIIRSASRSISLSKEARDKANLMFRAYLWWYTESKYTYYDAEIEFRIPYILPNGRKIYLVGKTDELLWNPREKVQRSLWVQENKTMEKIQETKIEANVIHDLQSMMYVVCMGLLTKKPITGIVYNVIRQPTQVPSRVDMNKAELEKWKQKHPKSTAKTRQETWPECLDRIDADIEKRPGHYFKRWEIPLTQAYIDEWRRTTFDPLLTQICMWWDSVKHDPFSPWTLENGERNPHHFQRPFGVFDPMTLGKGDYFDYITRGLTVDVTVGNPPFEELPSVAKKVNSDDIYIPF